MLSTDYFRNNVQPLGVNNSLNMQSNASSDSSMQNSFGSGFYRSEDHVPVDRPLFVNTSMSASQRSDLYRRLSDLPKDDQPALAFSGFRHF
ncbi:unnamed protein product [Caenorhabditis bovis]|uniref:Uncharacterized protein n=1 Tax=Caenorhabditis bovis TaxID=2654633 RepID=A0A8S1EBH1_9PELO|nr:unnamed protein product [Caenorhabditis bovis]